MLPQVRGEWASPLVPQWGSWCSLSLQQCEILWERQIHHSCWRGKAKVASKWVLVWENPWKMGFWRWRSLCLTNGLEVMAANVAVGKPLVKFYFWFREHSVRLKCPLWLCSCHTCGKKRSCKTQPWSVWAASVFPAVLWFQCILLSDVLHISSKPVLNDFDGAVSSSSPSLVSAVGSQIVCEWDWTWLICIRATQCCDVHCECKLLHAFKCCRCTEHPFKQLLHPRSSSLWVGTLEIPTVYYSLSGRGDSAVGAPGLHWRVFPYPVNHKCWKNRENNISKSQITNCSFCHSSCIIALCKMYRVNNNIGCHALRSEFIKFIFKLYCCIQ